MRARPTDDGVQDPRALHYPHLTHTVIFQFGRGFLIGAFYFRSARIAASFQRDDPQSADDEAPVA